MELKTMSLCKQYGDGEARVEALKPCTFTIQAGERVAITGESGSGKSTLLHLLGGLERPTDGCVLYDGREIIREGEAAAAEFRLRNIGFVFQAYNLLPELTAYENIVLPALLNGKKPDSAFLEPVLRELGLTQRLNHLPGQLSGGQQQRAALARALVNRPQLLLCDEPTGNLDSKTTDAVLDLLDKTAQQYGLTLVVVTHNAAAAARFPRVLTICDGVVGGDL